MKSEYYQKHRERILADRKRKWAARTPEEKQKHYDVCRRLHQRRRTVLDLFKHFTGCKYCGEDDPCKLDFDHRDPASKDIKVSTLNSAWAKIKKELKKCDVVCCNCHQARHRTRPEWMI